MALKLTTTKAGGESVWFFCNGCDTHHCYTTKLGKHGVGPVWAWNGDLDKPTFTPSLLCNKNLTPEHRAAGGHRCHLWLKAGMVQYLGDCTHALKNTTVPVEPPK